MMEKDNSIMRFKGFLHYEKTENGMEATLNGITFAITSRGIRHHLDVIRDGKRKAIGNYNLLEWAEYEAPYFWWIKYVGEIGDINPAPSPTPTLRDVE